MPASCVAHERANLRSLIGRSGSHRAAAINHRWMTAVIGQSSSSHRAVIGQQHRRLCGGATACNAWKHMRYHLDVIWVSSRSRSVQCTPAGRRRGPGVRRLASTMKWLPKPAALSYLVQLRVHGHRLCRLRGRGGCGGGVGGFRRRWRLMHLHHDARRGDDRQSSRRQLASAEGDRQTAHGERGGEPQPDAEANCNARVGARAGIAGIAWRQQRWRQRWRWGAPR